MKKKERGGKESRAEAGRASRSGRVVEGQETSIRAVLRGGAGDGAR